jgi:leucyl aminopeptidase
LANYKFERKEIAENKCTFKQLTNLDIYHPTFNPEDPKNKFIIDSAKYALLCREMLNIRANEATTEAMLELCKDLAKVDPNIQIEYIVGDELVKRGMNLIHEVGKGGPHRSSLVCLKYEGNPQDKDNIIALVGKGVCFDTGGMNLKPTGGIENMHYDKGGACTVLSAFLGAVEMKLPVNIVCSVAFVENSMSDRAVHPKDIITSYKGLTVEIGNTDAEGRLILADTMTYTQEKYKPKKMIEFSTLTGAIKVALGNETAGVFSNSDSLANDIYSSGVESCEAFWRLPINEEHREDVKSNIADLSNKPKSPVGGSSKAAAFLENFVNKDVKWAHVDIAGTSCRDGEKFVYNSGATGHAVKTLLNYLKKQGEKQ